jgi:hypothetical protein
MKYTIFYPRFQYKKYLKVLERYVKHLKIETEGEMFVLQNILDRDFGRDIILISIEEIRLKSGLIYVKCRTRNGSYHFCVSDIEGNGWKEGITQRDKEVYINGDLHHKMD